MIWSRARFEEEGARLCGCLQEIGVFNDSRTRTGSGSGSGSNGENERWSSAVAATTKDDPQLSAFALLHWELVRRDAANGTFLYLRHAAIATALPRSVLDSQYKHGSCDRCLPQQQQQQQQQQAQDSNLEDDSIWVDSELYTPEDNNEQSRPIHSILEWTFSVVYSDTYQVPVLYFHVQNPDGAPCSRSQVVQWLVHSQNTSSNESSSPSPSSISQRRRRVEEEYSSWEFVSQEQHPITGFPSYFLHPCRTLERMTLLEAPAPAALVADESSSSSSSESSIHFLWAWMSMILPAVNHTIPPKFYRMVQDKLQTKKQQQAIGYY